VAPAFSFFFAYRMLSAVAIADLTFLHDIPDFRIP
jgi:hypothetical protein